MNLWMVLMAQTAGGTQQPGLLVSLLPFLIILAIFYVLVILPQSRAEKKRREMLAALQKGDRVVTVGGLIGIITRVEPEVVSLRVAQDVVVKVERDSVKRVLKPAQKSGQ
ncbi:MAG: preprotein translocase subunit YajC [Candidatus Hydrothermae bacterium]|nr:preprotein translocase subunit YajC [Candidatus Hydrothermae bacterium]